MPEGKAPAADMIVVEDRGAVRILRMNRPDKMNALNTALLVALRDALAAADQDDAVRALVLTGEGRGFTAGADMAEFREPTPQTPKLSALRSELLSRIQIMLRDLRKPVVAAVHGAAIGGGAAFAISCDMVVAGTNLKFGYPELAHGLTPTAVLAGLQRQVGRKIAFEMISMGTLIGAEDAKAIGLVNRVVPPDAVLSTALEIAEVWAGSDPAQMAATKNMFYRMEELPFEAAQAVGRDISAGLRRANPKT